MARGDVGSWSDVDLIVVKTDKKFLDRLDEIYEDADVAMDVLVYTPEEFEKMKNRSFIRKAIGEGKYRIKPNPIDGFYRQKGI